MTTEHGWTASGSNNGLSVPEAMIQKTVNWFAAAIHTADASSRVTNGAQTFDYCSTASGKSNLYSDAALRAAGSKQNGTLDFYEVHYYTVNGTSNSAFMYPASHWALDKNLVMGEFWAVTTDGVNGADLYTHALRQRLQRRLGLELRDQRRQRRQPDDRLAGHEDADAEPLQRADGDAERLPLTRVDYHA